MKVCCIFEAGIRGTVRRNHVRKTLEEITNADDLRSCILLSIPFACTLKALTSTAEVMLFLEINLSDLFFSISSLTEATSLS